MAEDLTSIEELEELDRLLGDLHSRIGLAGDVDEGRQIEDAAVLAGDSPAAGENRSIRGAEAALARQRSREFRDALARIRDRATAVRADLRAAAPDAVATPSRLAGPSGSGGSGGSSGSGGGGDAPTRYGDRLAATLDASARELLPVEGTDDTLAGVVAGALQSVPHARRAGVSLVRGRGVIEARAPSDDVVARLDALQSELDEGPCLDASRTRRRVVIADLGGAADRWPRFASAARDLGVHSLVAVPLAGLRASAGALNLYADRPRAFDDEDLDLAELFAAQAAVALRGAQRADGLVQALETRDVIGQAKGILMERFSLDAQAAFDLLSRSSQDANLKLQDVARWLVGETTGGG